MPHISNLVNHMANINNFIFHFTTHQFGMFFFIFYYFSFFEKNSELNDIPHTTHKESNWHIFLQSNSRKKKNNFLMGREKK